MNDGTPPVNEEESNGETGKELNVARSFGHSSFIIDSLFMIGDSSLFRTPQCL
jgi:hypothetical protein